LKIAIKRLGKGSGWFYKLTWYDWIIWLEKIIEDNEALLEADQARWQRWRLTRADFLNSHRGKGDPEVKPQDIIRLPIDDGIKNEEVKTGLSFKEAKEKLGGRIKHHGKQ
jgi:hypothetical protein